MNVLVDGSVWVDYFRAGRYADILDTLIEDNRIVTNDLILAELIPPFLVKRQHPLVALLREIERLPLIPDWDDITRLQLICLRHGINAVGIPDLLIVQNAMQNGVQLLTRDKHFTLLARHTPLLLSP